MTPVDPHLLHAVQASPFDRAAALRIFTALSQPARLAVFLQLVRAGPAGCSARTLAEGLMMTGSALTLHLRALETAGLVAVRLRPRDTTNPLFVVQAERFRRFTDWMDAHFGEAGWPAAERQGPPKAKRAND